MVKIPGRYLAPLLIVYLLYATVFIYQTSFVLNGQRYFSLFDDAMVAMRYARNLAEGYGLVWNPRGERVEGVTTPLWTMYMAVWHLFRLPESKISLAIQLTSAAFLALNLALVWAVSIRLTGKLGIGAAAAILTAFFYPLNFWALEGMETGLLALIVIFATGAVLSALETGKVSSFAYFALALAVWVRPDAAVLYGAVLCFLLLRDRANWKRHLCLGGGLLVAAISLQTAARVWYFGDWLPNTYYLKMTGSPVGVRLLAGFKSLVRQIGRTDVILVLSAFLSPLVRRDNRSLLLTWLIVAQSAYSVYVGGDAWESAIIVNRYVAVVMPLFFILLVDSTWLIGKHFLMSAWSRVAGLTVFVIVSLVLFNAYPAWSNKDLPTWLLIRPPYHASENAQTVTLGLMIRSITEKEAKVAVTWGGATPYFADRYCIDLLGKSDRHIARLPMHAFPGGFRPGHQKWNYQYSLEQLQPDVVAHLGYRHPNAFWESDAGPFLTEYARLQPVSSFSWDWVRFPLHVRCGSPTIKWSLLPQIGLTPSPACRKPPT